MYVSHFTDTCQARRAFDQAAIAAQSTMGDLIELARVEFEASRFVNPMAASPTYVREEVAKKPLP